MTATAEAVPSAVVVMVIDVLAALAGMQGLNSRGSVTPVAFVANAVTAFFVTHANAPTKEELLAQIEKASDK